MDKRAGGEELIQLSLQSVNFPTACTIIILAVMLMQFCRHCYISIADVHILPAGLLYGCVLIPGFDIASIKMCIDVAANLKSYRLYTATKNVAVTVYS